MNNKIQKNFFTRLAVIYDNMDRSWDNVASAYGFKCTGCMDNCCETEFYHYTYIGKDYLISGMDSLEAEIKKQILSKAEKVNRRRTLAKKAGERIRIMCPLNKNNRCMLYKFRPMICRLHGIPHELCKPGLETIMNPGCDAGTALFNSIGYIKFNRTPFYSEMAAIEMDYKNATGKSKKIKQTIAQMLFYNDHCSL